MASTLAAAIAEVEGPRFDAVVGYTVERPEPAPVDEEITAAFAGVDREFFGRLIQQLVSQCGSQPADAEEAMQNASLELLVKRPDLFREEPARWTGLLYETARYRLLDIRGRQGQIASIEALTEIAGDAPFEKANPCVPLSHDGGSEFRYVPAPQDGEEWSQSRIIGALQRFRDYYGRLRGLRIARKSMGCPALRRYADISRALSTPFLQPEWFQKLRCGDGASGGHSRLRRSAVLFDGETAVGRVGPMRGAVRVSYPVTRQ